MVRPRADEVVGRSDADYFSEEHARQALADEQQILRTGEGLIDVLERETWPDREDTWVSSTKLPLRAPNGDIVGTWGMSRNHTARVQAERLLAERTATLEQVQQELTNLLEGSPDGMMRFDTGAEARLRQPGGRGDPRTSQDADPRPDQP